jgi:hypothetical protein
MVPEPRAEPGNVAATADGLVAGQQASKKFARHAAFY